MEKPDSSGGAANRAGRRCVRVPEDRTCAWAVEVTQSNELLVITLHNARALPEQWRFRQSEETAELHEVYRELFAGSLDWLREEVGRITGLQIGAVTVASKAPTGAVVVLMTGDV